MKKKLFRLLLANVSAEPVRWERDEQKWTHFGLELVIEAQHHMMRGTTVHLSTRSDPEARVGFNPGQARKVMKLLSCEAKRQHAEREAHASIALLEAFGREKSPSQ